MQFQLSGGLSFEKLPYFQSFIFCEIRVIAHQPLPKGCRDGTWIIIGDL